MTRDFYAVLALASVLAAPAAAQERSRPGAGSVLSVAVPERAAAMRIRAEARARLLDALTGPEDGAIGPAPDVLLEQAIVRYRAVLEVFPDDGDAWLELGRALGAFHRTMADGRQEQRIDEAIDAYEHARAIDGTREEAFVGFELAVLHTQRGEYGAAEIEYARAYAARGPPPNVTQLELGTWTRREYGLAHLFLPQGVETTLANWAEITMLAGDPTTAAERYRAALALASTATDSAALALWGLALAEERAGSHADALETALRAIDADHSADRAERSRLVDHYGAFAILHADNVFFEPACEIHAYESLGHEALAMRASTAEGRVAEWTAARLSARFFLAEGGRTSLYASIAHDAEARLSQLLAS